MSDTEDTRIVWCDLETTGLSDDALILEAGIIVTDAQLNELVSISWLVDNRMSVRDIQELCDPVVLEMHERNGLWRDLSTGELIEPVYIQDDLLGLFADENLGPKVAPLAGSSIHFDRRLVRRDLPMVDLHCHYRNIDVSTVKELCRRWSPTVYQSRPGKDEADKKHRVLDDIRGSITELVYYSDNFLKGELL